MKRIALMRVLFSVLCGLGGAGLVQMLLERLPAALVLSWQASAPLLFSLLPIVVGAGAALAHVFWLRGLLLETARRVAARPKPASAAGPAAGERWRPEIRN